MNFILSCGRTSESWMHRQTTEVLGQLWIQCCTAFILEGFDNFLWPMACKVFLPTNRVGIWEGQHKHPFSYHSRNFRRPCRYWVAYINNQAFLKGQGDSTLLGNVCFHLLCWRIKTWKKKMLVLSVISFYAVNLLFGIAAFSSKKMHHRLLINITEAST